MRKGGMENLQRTGDIAGKGQEEDRGSHFSKEFQNRVGSQRLNLFSARKAGTIGIRRRRNRSVRKITLSQGGGVT